VDLVFRVWPGLEPISPSLAASLIFLAVSIPAAFRALGVLFERVATRGVAPRS
jgi:hypothetical protein